MSYKKHIRYILSTFRFDDIFVKAGDIVTIVEPNCLQINTSFVLVKHLKSNLRFYVRDFELIEATPVMEALL